MFASSGDAWSRRWRPNQEQRELFDKRKADLLCFLTVFKEGIHARKLYGKFYEETDTIIEYTKMGFFTLGEFLYECRDILRVKSDGYNYFIFLRGSVPSDVDHIRQLVQQQSGRTKYKGFVAKQNNTWDMAADNLLHVNYDLRLTTANPPSQAAVARPLMSSGYNTYPSRQRGGGMSRSSGYNSRSRTSTLGSTVPVLMPLNHAALTSTSSAPNGLFSTLRPLNAAAAALSKPLLQNQDNPSATVSRTSTLPALPILRHSKANLENTKPVNKVPTLMPLSEIQKSRELHKTTDTPPATSNLSSSTFNSSTLPLPGHNRNGYGGGPAYGRSQASFRVRDDLPRPPPMDSLRREVPAGLARAINMALNNDNEGSDDGLEYLTDSSSEDEFLFVAQQQQQPPPPQVLTRRLNSLEDECMDEIDATMMTAEKIQEESTTTSISNGLESIAQKENYDYDGSLLERFKFPNVKPARGNKTMFKVERQMKLPDKEFDAILLGADPYGFIYIQVDCPRLREAFKGFLGQLEDFYSEPGRQDEYRMRPDEMKTGNLVIVEVMDVGFCRGRIDEIVADIGYCVVFNIDDCVYHLVKLDDIYHIDVKFTCARRLPMAIMCIQRGTEQIALTPQFEKMFSKGLETLTENIKVQEIKKLDSQFKVPVVSIRCNDQGLHELIYKLGGVNGYRPVYPITSLTAEQRETMEFLENKHHIIYTKV